MAVLAEGSAYSAWTYRRQRSMRKRVVGNVLIALGALVPGLGGLLSRLGIAG